MRLSFGRGSLRKVASSRTGLSADAAMRRTMPHAHGDVASSILERFEDAWHGLRTDLLGGAAEAQAGFDHAALIEDRRAYAAGA